LECRRSNFTRHSRREYEKVLAHKLNGLRIPISTVFFLCKMSNGAHSLTAGKGEMVLLTFELKKKLLILLKNC
jgi:hypothetical protein